MFNSSLSTCACLQRNAHLKTETRTAPSIVRKGKRWIQIRWQWPVCSRSLYLPHHYFLLATGTHHRLWWNSAALQTVHSCSCSRTTRNRKQLPPIEHRLSANVTFVLHTCSCVRIAFSYGVNTNCVSIHSTVICVTCTHWISFMHSVFRNRCNFDPIGFIGFPFTLFSISFLRIIKFLRNNIKSFQKTGNLHVRSSELIRSSTHTKCD